MLKKDLALLRYRVKVKLFDWSFYGPTSWLTAGCLYVASVVLRPVAPSAAFSSALRAHYLLMRTARYDASSSKLYRRIETSIAADVAQRLDRIGIVRGRSKAPHADGPAWIDTLKHTALVLKAPRRSGSRVVEKGVFLLANNERARAFAERIDMAALLDDYTLVLEPSWAGYANRDILYFTQFRSHRVAVMETDHRDRQFLEHLGANLHPVFMGTSDWIDPAIFRPLGDVEKLFDAVMVARWSVVKRYDALFRIVRSMGDPSFRMALIGRRLAISTDGPAIRSLLDHHGIARQVTIFEELAQEDVNVVLNQSKVNVLLSRHEGSNKSLFEGFFAGVPGLALENNVGIPKTYFTPETGRLVAEHEFAAALSYFRTHWREFAPHSWAQRNIAPEVTTARLNAVLRTWAQEDGEEWTSDAVAKCTRLRYYPGPEVARALPTIKDILAQYRRV
jgi:glycosyltransferase involved in cell wall biosynthesis